MKYIHLPPSTYHVRVAVHFPAQLTRTAIENPNITLGLVEYRDIDLVVREAPDGAMHWVGYDKEGDTLYIGDVAITDLNR